MRSRLAAAGLLLAAVPLLVLGCGGGGNPVAPPPPPPPPAAVASVMVTPGADTLTSLGQTRQLTAVAKDASGNPIAGKTFSWTSTPPGIVTVDPVSGLATAAGNGQATVSASVDGKSGSSVLLVDQQVATVEITPPSAATAALGTVQQFGAVAKDASGAPIAGVKFLWVSSDPSVASVDSTGKVTARAPGVATITAAARGVPANAVFTVTQAATQLAVIIQPTASTEGQQLPGSVQIEIRDAAGALVTGAGDAVTLSIGTNPSSGTLGGATTVSAVGGIATFNGLILDRAGQAYTLVASAAGLAPVTTAPFNVFLDFVSVAAGNLETCGITASGPTYCWGANTAGAIGDGTNTNRFRPTRVLVPPGVRFASISVGSLGTVCALSTHGAAYCWGTGNLGVPAPSSSTTPILVASPPGITFTAIAVGGQFSCGITPGGAAYCWGSNTFHNLGDGTTTTRLTPVAALSPPGALFSAVSSDGSSTCATTAGGAGYCWGFNTAGQVGNGTTTEPSAPVAVTQPGGVTFTSIVTGGSYACGVSFAGAIYCWGANGGGQLGDGTTTNRLIPTPVVAPAGVTFTQVVAYTNGIGGVSCGLATIGTPYCWGDNAFGMLGDGTTASHILPAPVSMPAGVTFVQISGSQSHVCGVTSRGAVYCWGANSIGELGDNSGTTRLTPVRVAR